MLIHARNVHFFTKQHNLQTVVLSLRQTLDSDHKHCAASVAAWQPACPRLAELLCLIVIHRQDAASLETTLQEQHAVAPKGLKATPIHCLPWLLWMHPCLHQKHITVLWHITIVHYIVLLYTI